MLAIKPKVSVWGWTSAAWAGERMKEMSAGGALGCFRGTAPLVGRRRRLPTPFSLCLSVCPSISVSLTLSDRRTVEREEEEEGHWLDYGAWRVWNLQAHWQMEVRVAVDVAVLSYKSWGRPAACMPKQGCCAAILRQKLDAALGNLSLLLQPVTNRMRPTHNTEVTCFTYS